jgi:Flp pilus assembly protein TadG
MAKKSGSNSGQAIVELALTLPLLVILVVGIVEYGVIYYDKAMLTNASREGARTGIVFQGDGTTSPPTCVDIPNSAITTAVNNYLQTRLINFGGAGAANTTITRTGTSPDCDINGGTVKVAVSYVHTYLMLPRFLSGSNTITIGAETTMRRE